MAPFLDEVYGNPSGVHAVSRRAKDALEDARERAAALVGADTPLDVVFTGGGTESDNLGVAGPALAGGGRGGVVTTAVEHEAVLDTARFLERLGCPVAVIGVDAFGRVDPEEVAGAKVGEVVTVVGHLRGPFLDDEELVGETSLVHQVLPCLDVHLVRPPSDLLPLPVGQPREKRDLPQPRGVHVPSLSR